jgi:excinuclease ABC subunit C
MTAAAEAEQYEAAARLRDQLSTVHQLQEKQRIVTVEQSDDADVFGYHFEDGSLAVNLFHVRAGKIVDRREFFWEDLPGLLEAAAVNTEQGATSELGAAGLESETWETSSNNIPFNAGKVFSALLKQLYIDQHYVPRSIFVPVNFDDREALATLLSERVNHRIEIAVPQRGEKRSLVDLAGQNAKQSYIQRFRVLEPSRKAIQESLADSLMLPELPARIECFDISHIQGAETVASMVVWEDGKMNKSQYRKFKIMTVLGVDDFASMREVVTRRYRRLKEEDKPMPSLILIDGGLGQLHAAAEALETLGFTSQPLASIAKKEEVIYLYGNEDEPVVLDRRSPVLHLVQMIRDESHRFAIGYHRQRRAMRDRDSELLNIPGVGQQTRQRLLTHFGSLRDVQQATADSLVAVVSRKTAESIWRHFHESQPTTSG